MKTAGDLLKNKRLALELNLEEVSRRTKVKPEYLSALEDSDFDRLPNSVVTKGYLKSYAKVLHINPDTLIAMYRRDYEEVMGAIMPHGLVEPLLKRTHLLSIPLILATVAILGFVGFLLYQLVNYWRLPSLEVIQPLDGDLYGETITIKGRTAPTATIKVDDQTILVNQDGEFSLERKYPAGTHRILIQATDREGKSRLLERTFTVSK